MKLYFFLFISFLVLSCRKQELPLDPIPGPPSERYVALTKHSWNMTHEYIDSTSYAKSNLTLWPLSTTDDFMDMYDTCSWDSKSLFLSDGSIKLIKSPVCDASISTDAGHWKLINNDNDFVIVDQDTLHVVELTKTSLKMYYKRYTWMQGQLVLTEYCMWTFKAAD